MAPSKRKKSKKNKNKNQAEEECVFLKRSKESIITKRDFFSFVVEELKLQDSLKTLFMDVAEEVGKDFSVDYFQDRYAHCMRTRVENKHRLEPNVYGDPLKKCNHEDMAKINELLNGDKDLNNFIKTWLCPISLNRYAVFQGEKKSYFEPEGLSRKRKEASPPMNNVISFVKAYMIQLDVPSDGDCFLHCLYEALKDNDQYVADIAKEAGDDSTTFAGNWPDSVEEFIRCSKDHLAKVFVDDEGLRNKIMQSLSYCTRGFGHPDGFISQVASHLSKPKPSEGDSDPEGSDNSEGDSDKFLLLAKILAHPGMNVTTF